MDSGGRGPSADDRPRRRTRVALGDGRTLFRVGLARLLADQPDLDLVGQAQSADELVRLAETVALDVVAIEARLPGGAVRSAREIRLRAPHRFVLLYGLDENDPTMAAAVQAGVSGFVDASADFDHVVNAIRQVASGSVVVTPALAAQFTGRTAGPESLRPRAGQLTAREVEILQLVAAGHSNRAVARALMASENTVRGHLRSVFQKLGVRNRVQAVSEALRTGLIARR